MFLSVNVNEADQSAVQEPFVKFRHMHKVLSVLCVHQVQLHRPKCCIGVLGPFCICEFMPTVTSVHLCRVLLILLDATEILSVNWNWFLR